MTLWNDLPSSVWKQCPPRYSCRSDLSAMWSLPISDTTVWCSSPYRKKKKKQQLSSSSAAAGQRQRPQLSSSSSSSSIPTVDLTWEPYRGYILGVPLLSSASRVCCCCCRLLEGLWASVLQLWGCSSSVVEAALPLFLFPPSTPFLPLFLHLLLSSFSSSSSSTSSSSPALQPPPTLANGHAQTSGFTFFNARRRCAPHVSGGRFS